MLQITSKDNPRIKELARLCSSARERRESGLFVLEGVRLVRDAQTSGVPIRTLFVTPDGMRRLGEGAEPLIAAAEETFEISDALACRVGDTVQPQGVFAVCRGTLARQGLPEKAENGIILLAGLQDPGNVGTILRSAAAFGLSGVVMSRDCPDPASPKVLRAAMGVRPAWQCDDICMAIDALRARGVPVYAAALGEGSVPVDAVPLAGAAVVIGNEGSGLPQSVISRCTMPVILPIAPGCESLNAAMAATVFAWELSRAARRASR